MRRKWKEFREDKRILREPRCPFCNETFEPPLEISTQVGFFTGGTCKCGAVYVYDISGKNLGEAYVDALSYACKEDWDMAMSLEPEKDYTQVMIEYNDTTHSIIPHQDQRGYRFHEKSGKMIFLKIRNEDSFLTEHE